MMKYLSLPDQQVRILPFYLSMEEYAARIIGDEDIFFMWQVEPTVIFGRNQLIASEVNVDYCRQHGIAFYRRRSGGGCVYADRDNIMMSYITRSSDVTTTFARYTGAVAQLLRDLGLNASDNTRNDVLIDGRKVSGNAFYHLPGVSIVHGTMLYDTDMEHMLHAITPSRDKLTSKGVASVRSHITTLREHLSMDIEAFKRHVRHSLCDGELMLTPTDVTAIEHIMQGYLDPHFIEGNDPRCQWMSQARYEGVGHVAVSVELHHHTLQRVRLSGDYLELGDAQATISQWLHGVPYHRADVEAVLADKQVGSVIMNMTNEQFINLLMN